MVGPEGPGAEVFAPPQGSRRSSIAETAGTSGRHHPGPGASWALGKDSVLPIMHGCTQLIWNKWSDTNEGRAGEQVACDHRCPCRGHRQAKGLLQTPECQTQCMVLGRGKRLERT